LNQTVTFNERQAIKEYIDYLKQDNERLTQVYREQRDRNMMEYKEAMKRLRVLDEIDRKIDQPSELPVLELTPVANVNQDLQQMIDQRNKEKGETKPFEYDRQKEEVRERVYRANRKSPRNNIKELTNEIASYLKEEGVPKKASEIIKSLRNNGTKLNNPYNILARAKEYDPRIEMITKGIYQYKH